MAEIILTDNEKKIGDSLVIALQYAKQQLPAGSNLVEYVAGEIGKLADKETVTVAQVVDAGFDLSIAICNEANAPHVSEVFVDLKAGAEDALAGKFVLAFAKLFALIHDFQVIKKQGK